MGFPGTDHPTAFTFGILGNAVSFMVFLAPIPTFYRIWRKKSTEGFQSVPYLVALFSSMLWLYYAMLKGTAILLVTINSFGCVIETIYIIMYLTYASKDATKLTLKYFISMNVGAFSFFIIVTHYAAPEHLHVKVFGWICTAVSICVFASPLSIVRQVYRTKSVEFMPFYLSVFLTISAVMWFGYGFFSHDKCIYIPNIIGFVLGILQMILYVKYRRAEPVIPDEKVPEPFKDIIVLSNLGARDVYVVDIPPNYVNGDDDGARKNEKEGDENDDARVPNNGESAI